MKFDFVKLDLFEIFQSIEESNSRPQSTTAPQLMTWYGDFYFSKKFFIINKII